jgi:hypothetical protein
MRRVDAFFEDQRSRFPQSPLQPGQFDALQIRAFSFKEMPDLAATFMSCFQRDGDLGSPFFLATMHEPIRSHFEKRFKPSSLRTLSARVAADQMTGKGADSDIESLVDMIILALSRRLFMSPGSTFGMFSAAFGEMQAIRVNWKQRLQQPTAQLVDGKICERVPSFQPCFASWYKYDHLLQRSNLGSQRPSGNDVPCTLRPMPKDTMFC